MTLCSGLRARARGRCRHGPARRGRRDAGAAISLVPTGLTIELPPGYEAQVRPRSGLALKHAITMPNARHHRPRLSRRDPRDPAESGAEAVPHSRGRPIAQMVIARYEAVEWEEGELADSAGGRADLARRAAENTNRRCRMVAASPRRLTLLRWADPRRRLRRRPCDSPTTKNAVPDRWARTGLRNTTYTLLALKRYGSSGAPMGLLFWANLMYWRCRCWHWFPQ